MSNYKKYFPIFEKNSDLHYLDSGATTLKPKMVLYKMMEFYTDYSANIHRGLYPISERATEEYENARAKMAKFIGAKHAAEIIFTSGTTDSLNLVARGWAEQNLKEDDEIMVTVAEHHSNFVPWQQLAKKRKLKIVFLPITNYELKITNEINQNTKLLAINHVSNVLGNINDIKSIIKKARGINPEICVVVDGAQAVAHLPVDVVDLDCDFYAFSGHKMYGPTGIGVLYAKARRQMEMTPGRFGGGMIKTVTIEDSDWANGPEKFEAGTPPIAEAICMGAAIDFIKEIGFEVIQKNENELLKYLITELEKFKWIKILGDMENRIGLVAFGVTDDGPPAHDVASILGRNFGVCVRAGHHCTMPLHKQLGFEYGSVRISLGIYNNHEDIEKLVEGLADSWETFQNINLEMDYVPGNGGRFI